jgi:hypothetical protein
MKAPGEPREDITSLSLPCPRVSAIGARVRSSRTLDIDGSRVVVLLLGGLVLGPFAVPARHAMSAFFCKCPQALMVRALECAPFLYAVWSLTSSLRFHIEVAHRLRCMRRS